jgi:hypothetical protein
MKKKDQYLALKWSARILGSLLVIFTLFIFIGELIESHDRAAGLTQHSYSPLIIIIFVTWGIALAGLVVAIWKEGLGGLISFVSFMLVWILNLFNKEATMNTSAIMLFLFFSIPAILYLLYWKLNKDDAKQATIQEKVLPDNDQTSL